MKPVFTRTWSWLLLVMILGPWHTTDLKAQIDPFKGQELDKSSSLSPTFNNTSYDLSILTGNSFTWQEIGSTGTLVSFMPDTDDGHAYFANLLNFDFNFFDEKLRDIAIATNGTIYFEDAYLGLQATPIPGETSYPPVQRLIAHFWSDLLIRPSSKVLYQLFSGYLIVQFESVDRFAGNGTSTGTWQIVLTDAGSIIIRYKDIERLVASSPGIGSIGVQGSSTEGIQIQSIPENDMAFCIKPDTAGASCSTSALPVDFVNIQAYLDNDNLVVDWSTASEENNAGFEIQANNGSGYRTLGYVSGKGTTDFNTEYTFKSEILSPDTYNIRVKQVDFDGSFSYSDETELDIVVTQGFVLNSVYPNPFKGETTFSFAVGVEQNVKVELFDLLGKKVSTLLEEEVLENKTRYVGIDGSGLHSGIYIVRVTGDQFTATRTINLLK